MRGTLVAITVAFFVGAVVGVLFLYEPAKALTLGDLELVVRKYGDVYVLPIGRRAQEVKVDVADRHVSVTVHDLTTTMTADQVRIWTCKLKVAEVLYAGGSGSAFRDQFGDEWGLEPDSLCVLNGEEQLEGAIHVGRGHIIFRGSVNGSSPSRWYRR